MRVLCALLLLVAAQARAELVQYGEYVKDTVTGLEWLNSISTLGANYSQANLYPGGWRHATRKEIDALAKRYIGSAEGTYSGGRYFNRTLRIIGLLGVTYQSAKYLEPAQFSILGYYDDGSFDGGVGVADLTVILFTPADDTGQTYPDAFVGRWITLDNALPAETTSAAISSFMVRSPSP